MLAALTTSDDSTSSEQIHDLPVNLQKQHCNDKDLIANEYQEAYSHHSDKETTSSASLALASTWIRNCVLPKHYRADCG